MKRKFLEPKGELRTIRHSQGWSKRLDFSPAHPELPRQLVSQVGYVEDLSDARTMLEEGIWHL